MGARWLGAKGGLTLSLAERGWALRWEGFDWLGPLGLRIRQAGRVRAGPSAPGVGPAGEALAPLLRDMVGSDDLGPYEGVEVRWQPQPLPITTTVRAYADLPVIVFRIEAREELRGLATGAFAEPSVAWPWIRPVDRARRPAKETPAGFAYQVSEFAFPTFSFDGSLADFFLLPHRPRAVTPLWILRGDRCLMIAPLDGFHEQVIAVPERAEASPKGLRCGWQGDLDVVPRGFATELAIWAGSSPRQTLEDWTALLRRRHGTERPTRYADELLSSLSYWTDNGGVYWYRTEPGRTVPETLELVARSLRESEIPCRAFQLDSWFYPHEKTRTTSELGAGAAEDVPPTGMLEWEAREDILHGGVEDLRRRLGSPPLVLHARHFSSRSPYFARYDAWLDGAQAHPSDPALLHHLIARATQRGAVTFEQDWLVQSFLGVRGLRERPGRARAWQEELDRAAAQHGLTLQWCMASPADFLQTLTLTRVTSIRTSGDYRYKVGSGFLWAWFLLTNALARGLGLHPFKDVFLSSPRGTGWEGDPHAEAEALLAALSAGPVGIGDRAGRHDRGVVLRTCRPDGVLVKPDLPIAALDRCFRTSPFASGELVGETHSDHPAGRWVYLAGFNVGQGADTRRLRVELPELGSSQPRGPVIGYDWRRGSWERIETDGAIEMRLDPLAWDLRVLCPVLEGGITLFGDVTRYATAGDRRVRDIRPIAGGIELEVLGAPGERVELRGWSATPIEGVEIDGRDAPGRWSRDPGTGKYLVEVVLGPSGRAAVRVVGRGR